jgi:hypothetical protein
MQESKKTAIFNMNEYCRPSLEITDFIYIYISPSSAEVENE